LFDECVRAEAFDSRTVAGQCGVQTAVRPRLIRVLERGVIQRPERAELIAEVGDDDLAVEDVRVEA